MLAKSSVYQIILQPFRALIVFPSPITQKVKRTAWCIYKANRLFSLIVNIECGLLLKDAYTVYTSVSCS